MKITQACSTLQRETVLRALRLTPTNTVQLRETWGVMSPAPRVRELRMSGYDIRSEPVTVVTADGVLHRNVARYELVAEPRTNRANIEMLSEATNDESFVERVANSVY